MGGNERPGQGYGLWEFRGTRGHPVGMETSVAGFTQGWIKIVQDSRRNVALFDFYGARAPAATKICFQTDEVQCMFSLILRTQIVLLSVN